MIGPSLETKAPRAVQLSASDRNIVLAAKGGGIVFAGEIIAQVFRFLFGVVVARFLGAQQFGLYRLGFSFVTLQSSLALLGLQAAAVRYIPIATREKDQDRLWGIIQVGLIGPGLIGLILSLLLFLFAEPVASQIFHDPALTPVLRWFSLHIPLGTLITMTARITQGFKKVQYNVYARNVAARLVKLVLASLLLAAGFGLISVVITQLVASTIALILLFYFLHTTFPLNRPLRAARRDIGELMRFSLPLYVSRLLRNLGGSFEALVLGFFGMTTGVGIFAAASIMSSISNLFYQSLGRIASPIFAELHSQKEYGQLKLVYQSVTRWAVAFNLPFFLAMIFFAEPLLSIFGKEFQAGATSLVIFAIGSLLNAATGQCGSMINMIGRSKVSAINSLVYLITTIAIDFLLIPRWGVEGAALAASLTLILINLLGMVEVYAFLRLWPFDWSLLKPLGASIVAAAAGYTVSQPLAQTPLIAQVALGIFVVWGAYAFMIVLLKFSPEDRLILNRLAKRLNLNWFRR